MTASEDDLKLLREIITQGGSKYTAGNVDRRKYERLVGGVIMQSAARPPTADLPSPKLCRMDPCGIYALIGRTGGCGGSIRIAGRHGTCRFFSAQFCRPATSWHTQGKLELTGFYNGRSVTAPQLDGYLPDGHRPSEALELGNIVIRPDAFWVGHTQHSLSKHIKSGILAKVPACPPGTAYNCVQMPTAQCPGLGSPRSEARSLTTKASKTHFGGSTTVFVDPSGAACIPGGL
jgi:hypothetical protein